MPIAKPPSRPARGRRGTIANAGSRLLNWLVHAPLILSGTTRRSARMLAAIAETARWLDRNVHAGR
jgi:hypothetical protein